MKSSELCRSCEHFVFASRAEQVRTGFRGNIIWERKYYEWCTNDDGDVGISLREKCATYKKRETDLVEKNYGAFGDERFNNRWMGRHDE